jgi:hypothetical protein
MINSSQTICEDKIYKYKNRYVVYAVHRRPLSQKIVFVFSGVDSIPGFCRMSYFGLAQKIDANVVHVMDNYGAHGCYLLNISGDNQIRNAVVSLIRQVSEELVKGIAETYFIGTSKGATTAIAYALMFGSGKVICGEPQILIGDFIYQKNWENFE